MSGEDVVLDDGIRPECQQIMDSFWKFQDKQIVIDFSYIMVLDNQRRLMDITTRVSIALFAIAIVLAVGVLIGPDSWKDGMGQVATSVMMMGIGALLVSGIVIGNKRDRSIISNRYDELLGRK